MMDTNKAEAVEQCKEIEQMLERLNGSILGVDDISIQANSTFSSVMRSSQPMEDRPDETECSSVLAETLRQYAVRLENITISIRNMLNRCEL